MTEFQELGSVPGSRACGSYLAGHQVHHIQALKAAKDDDRGWLGEVAAIEGTVIKVLDADGDTHRFASHDAAALGALLEREEHLTVRVQPRWHLIHVDRPGGSWLICISSPDTYERCARRRPAR